MESKSASTHSGKNGAEGMLNKAASGVHDAVDKVADDVVRSAKPAIKRVAGFAHDAVDKATDVVGPAAEWINEQGRGLKAKHKKVTAATNNYVKAHPWKAAGIALAAGFIISRLI